MSSSDWSITAGDLNSKHPLWNSRTSNPAGIILYNQVQKSNHILPFLQLQTGRARHSSGQTSSPDPGFQHQFPIFRLQPCLVGSLMYSNYFVSTSSQQAHKLASSNREIINSDFKSKLKNHIDWRYRLSNLRLHHINQNDHWIMRSLNIKRLEEKANSTLHPWRNQHKEPSPSWLAAKSWSCSQKETQFQN